MARDQIMVRVDSEITPLVDRYREAHGLSRSAACEALVRLGLALDRLRDDEQLPETLIHRIYFEAGAVR